MAVTVNLNSIVTNSMNTNTGVFLGENGQFGWDSNQKQNSIFSIIAGAYNANLNNFNVINNTAVNDGNIFDQDIKFGTMAQSV